MDCIVALLLLNISAIDVCLSLDNSEAMGASWQIGRGQFVELMWRGTVDLAMGNAPAAASIPASAINHNTAKSKSIGATTIKSNEGKNTDAWGRSSR